jgi:spore maturation protein CgeB
MWPAAYAAARVTVHIPRQHYATAMKGIPTILVFEALACGIPLDFRSLAGQRAPVP